jgi:hypothetical protein
LADNRITADERRAGSHLYAESIASKDHGRINAGADRNAL